MSHRTPVPPFLESYLSDKEGNSVVNQEALLWFNLVRSFSFDLHIETFTFNPASVAINTTVEQTVTVSGLKTGDIVLLVNKPSLSAGLGVLGGRASATDTLAITFINTTGSPINAGSETYTVAYIKNTRA